MEEPTLIRCPEQKLRTHVLHTSDERGWTGFDAKIYEVSGGFANSRPIAKHSVTMLVGCSIATSCRCDGLVSQRMQRAGEIDVIPAGCPARWEDGGVTTFVDVNIEHALLQSVADSMGVNAGRIAVAPFLHIRDPAMEHLAWALKHELESAAPFGRLYADHLGIAMAMSLVRRCARVPYDGIVSSLSARRLRRVTDYVHDHLAHDLTLAELAGVANVSPSHFKVLFKRSLGMPVHQYVIRRRVERAIDLLRSTGAPASAIALEAGFANQSHMALCMRRLTGLTPTALRRPPPKSP